MLFFIDFYCITSINLAQGDILITFVNDYVNLNTHKYNEKTTFIIIIYVRWY